jgi:hypothetical protein
MVIALKKQRFEEQKTERVRKDIDKQTVNEE